MSQASTQRVLEVVTNALCELAPHFIRFPTTVEHQARVKQGFYAIAGFPNVLGCIDGTHIHMKRPPREHPEQYMNRHHRFSMNVMAVCDSEKRFLNLYADFPGRNGDAHIWANSQLLIAFQNGTITDGWLLGK
jgi:DDE superfamily endonuclease